MVLSSNKTKQSRFIVPRRSTLGRCVESAFDKASPGVINLLVICIGALIIWWIATNLTALKKSWHHLQP